MRERNQMIPGLTGIRGVAAVAVFFCHFQPVVLSVFGLEPNAGWRLIGNGFRGVDLFFVLSGFILFHVHAGEFQHLTGPALQRFFLLRFFRVYPLNALVLVAMLPIPAVLPDFVTWYRESHVAQGSYHLGDFSLGAYVQSLMLAQAWTIVKLGTWNEPAWTLSAEVVGYAVFPLLAAFVVQQQSPRRLVLLSTLSLTGLVLLLFAFGHATNNPSGLFGTLRMAGSFVAGVALARVFHLQSLAPWLVTFITVSAAVASLGFICVDRLGTLSVFAFAWLIFGIAYQHGPISKFVSSGVVMFLGRISFSLYLIHLIPLSLFAWATMGRIEQASTFCKVGALTGIAVFVLLLAGLTHRLVEVPFQRLGRFYAARGLSFGWREERV